MEATSMLMRRASALLVVLATVVPASAAVPPTWSVLLPTTDCIDVMVTDDGGVLVVDYQQDISMADAAVTRLDATTGSTSWAFRADLSRRLWVSGSEPTPSRDAVVVAGNFRRGGYVGLVDASTGVGMWERTVRGRYDTLRHPLTIEDVAVMPDATAVVIAGTTRESTGGTDAFVESLDISTGKTNWFRRIDVRGDHAWMVAVSPDARLVFMTLTAVSRNVDKTALVSFRASDGHERWRRVRAGWFYGGLAVTPDGTEVIALTWRGRRAFSTRDGVELWSRSNGGRYLLYDMAIDQLGRVLATGANQGRDGIRTVRIDPSDGSIVWSVSEPGLSGDVDQGRQITVNPEDTRAVMVGYIDQYWGSDDNEPTSTMAAAAYDIDTGTPAWFVVHSDPVTNYTYGRALDATAGFGTLFSCGESLVARDQMP
jgi:hypothetical protein